MFRGCSALNVINLSNFDINKVNIKRYMFSGCSSLKEIYFHKNYDKKNYIYDKGMFYGCSAKINN
jgi:surface protein